MINILNIAKWVHHAMLKMLVIIFLHHFSRSSVSVKISNILIRCCSFYLSCPILEKENFINILYCIVLSY